MKKKNFVIYGLYHPNTAKLRYVGWTSRHLNIRLSEHISKANGGEKTHRSNWIRSLIRKNLVPEIKIIEKVTRETYIEREIYWISFFGRNTLVNGTDGGDGTLGNKPFLGRSHTKETKEYLRRINTGKVMSEETRRKISKANKGKPSANKGVPMSEDQKKKLSDSMMGRLPWNIGKKMSEEANRHLSERKKFLMTDEIRKNISDAKKGQPAPNKHKKLNVPSSSEYFGVYWYKKLKKWRARIVLDGNRKHVGTFSSEILAAQNFDLRICIEYGIKSEYDLNFPHLKPKYKKLINKGITKITEELK